MLRLDIPAQELWDSVREEFVLVKPYSLTLEHSLVSISKWEAKYHAPFLRDKPMSLDETRDYIRMMTITQNVPDNVYLGITDDLVKKVSDYIGDPMTATTFKELSGGPSGRKSRTFVTSELIYYWMFSYQIDMKCEKWHLNRLITLIRIFAEKNKQQSSNPKERAASRRALNAQRKAALNSRG